MRRNILKVTVTCLALMSAAQAAHAQGASPCAKHGLAFVFSQQILASIPEAIQADSLVRKDVAAYDLEIKKMQADLDSSYRAFQDQSTLLSAAQKATQMKKFEARQDTIRARANELSGKIDTRRAELFQPIEQRVTAVIDGLRAELQCSMIRDASNDNGIASVDPALNLTQRVIDRLKTGVTTKAPAKPPTGIKPPGGGGGGGGEEPQASSRNAP